jgi:peptide/nickel transport system permease protein
MIASGRDYVLTAWWIPTFPGVFISITVAGFMFLGDGLRDLLDPALRVHDYDAAARRQHHQHQLRQRCPRP